MFAMTGLRLLVAAIVVSALSALLAIVAFSSAASADHSWGSYHWGRASNPSTLKLGDNVTSTWDSYLRTTSSDWSASTVLDTTVVAGGTNRSNCRPTSGRIEVCNYKYGSNGWLGVAQVWISGGHIVQGTAKVNDTYFNRTKYNNPGWRNLVMCQEVGHDFGLDHQDENNSNTNLGTCMDYSSNPLGPPSNEHPNQHDHDWLDDTIYVHTDSTTTISTNAASRMPPAANQGAFNSRAEWGRQIRESDGGKLELWVRDFGGNNKMFTWVIRA